MSLTFVKGVPRHSGGKAESPRPFRYVDEAAELKANPGQWAILSRESTSHKASRVAQDVRTGRFAAFLPGNSFEATARTIRNEDPAQDEFRVYVRYVGHTCPRCDA